MTFGNHYRTTEVKCVTFSVFLAEYLHSWIVLGVLSVRPGYYLYQNSIYFITSHATVPIVGHCVASINSIKSTVLSVIFFHRRLKVVRLDVYRSVN